MGEPTRESYAWRALIDRLAALERPSASDGEREAAELIASELAARGCEVRIERERVHGGYWWPVGLPNVVAAAAGAGLLRGLRRRADRGTQVPALRLLACALAAAAAASLWYELGHGRRPLRRLLPRRETHNVIAQTGERTAERTLVLIAHHDAAHSGLVFHPAFGRVGPRLAPRRHERARKHAADPLRGVARPVAIAAGALTGARAAVRFGVALSLGAGAAMADIAKRRVVPGANDNLTAVGALMAVAESLQREPVCGLRVILLSTGSEESFSEGMQAFARRHFARMARDRMEFLCLECLGSSRLIVLEAEGLLRMRPYPQQMRDALAAAAARAGVAIERGVRTVAATDAIIALRAGYPVATLASVDDTKPPRNYHWPTDVPAALDWDTVGEAIATCEQFVRMRGVDPCWRRGDPADGKPAGAAVEVAG